MIGSATDETRVVVDFQSCGTKRSTNKEPLIPRPLPWILPPGSLLNTLGASHILNQ